MTPTLEHLLEVYLVILVALFFMAFWVATHYARMVQTLSVDTVKLQVRHDRLTEAALSTVAAYDGGNGLSLAYAAGYLGEVLKGDAEKAEELRSANHGAEPDPFATLKAGEHHRPH